MPTTETAPVIEREHVIEKEHEEVEEREKCTEESLSEGDFPPIFGKCPVCGKHLRPRCRFTGEPKAPPVGQGWLSRAKCDRCGAIIEYVGDGKWVPVEFLGEGEIP
jgi:hypothetical protein